MSAGDLRCGAFENTKVDRQLVGVVEHCKQYSGQPTSAPPSLAVLLEQIAGNHRRPCSAACANSGG